MSVTPQAVHVFVFWALAVLTGVCAVSVVVTTNIVRSATWLLFTLAGTSGLFFLLGADFVGATQLLVYVGGTLVLVVFGVMLTAQGPFVNLKAGPAEWAFSTVVGILLLSFLIGAVTVWKPHYGEPSSLTSVPESAAEGAPGPHDSMNSAILGQSFLGVKDAMPEGTLTGVPNAKTALPRKQMSYLLPFELVSVHLLVVLIGAAYLARAKRRRRVVLS